MNAALATASNAARAVPAGVGACPFHATAPAGPGGLAPDAVLVLPMARGMVVQYAEGEDGGRELRLYHGDKEVSFDEPELFAFGERLAASGRFVAADAVDWAPGLDWARVRGLLEALLDEGVLQRADGAHDPERIAPGDGERASPLPPGPCGAPASWHDCESITASLGGAAVEIGWLEAIVPIFRVAHPSLDGDGRQVGEANVFPPALRLDVPTRWRTCIYPGTRYQTERPMNVTALKAMRAHWPQMMALLLHVRDAYLRRFPEAREGWTVGHVERLSTAVLALPTYLLMRAEGRVAEGALHPALSCLFRVTDGLRMTMHQMLFVPFGEPTVSPDRPIDAAGILAYAERNYTFHSGHGVCAGPQAMVEAFLDAVLDGRDDGAATLGELSPEVLDAIAAIEPALDYGLLGLQTYAATYSVWPALTRGNDRLAAVLGGWAGPRTAPLLALRVAVDAAVAFARESGYLGRERWRAERDHVYADMHDRCAEGLARTPLGASFAARTGTAPMPADLAALRGPLHAALGGALGLPAGVALDDLAALADALLDHARVERALLAAAVESQRRIGGLLGRAAPRRPLSLAVLAVHRRLQGPEVPPAPGPLELVAESLGVSVRVEAASVSIVPADPLSPASAGRHGGVSAGDAPVPTRASRTNP